MLGVAPQERAYIAPFFAFLALLLLGELVRSLGDGYAHWALSSPQYWLFPLQTVVCGVMLIRNRRFYQLRPFSGFTLAFLAGAASLAVWVSPQWLFSLPPRTDGFDPERFGHGLAYFLVLSIRLIRMVIVVPLVEEIFWRGFLLRYCVREDFQNVPFGTFTWRSFLIVSVAFCFEHTRPDWAAALITSILYNAVAYRTRSLVACVVAHAVTNFLLALYILETRQWGFW